MAHAQMKRDNFYLNLIFFLLRAFPIGSGYHGHIRSLELSVVEFI